MANTKKFVAKNGLLTQNVQFVSPDQLNNITVTMLDSDTLSFNGDAGQLFSITDDMSGTIFAVNDISGVPSIEVDADGTIRLAETFGNVLIGTDIDNGTDKLQINGSVSATSFSGDGSTITNVDAATLDGQEGAFYQNASNLNAGTLPAARFDDTSHGSRSGGTLHSVATTAAAGFMSAADKTKLDGIESGAQVNTVDSVNTQTGAVVLDTDDVGEGVSNLYYTDARARGSISASGDISYNSTTGVISFSETYSTPTELMTAIQTVDGSTSGLDADLLDGQQGSYYLDFNNFTNVPTYDNYSSWNLLVDGSSKGGITSGENVNVEAGQNVNLAYSATNNTITINAEGGGIAWSIISTNTTAQPKNGYLVDTSAGPVTLTLPASPVEGDTIGVADYTRTSGTNNITVARNGNNIFGLLEDLVVNIDGAGLTLVYTNATVGWEIVSEIGLDRNQLFYSVDGANDDVITVDDRLDFVSGTNVTITPDTVNNKLTFNAVDTTYSAGTGITLAGTTFSLTDESYTLAEKNKLAGIEAGAEVNTVDSVNTQTGAVVLDTDDINEGISNLYYTQTRFDSAFGAKSTTNLSEGTNLYFTNARAVSAIQADASWNATNWDTAYSWGNHANAGYELASNKGVAGGYAGLDGTGKVPSTQLPSFVDDVEEYASQANFPVTGEQGKMYVALDTNKVYRWSGSAYIYITSGAVDSVNGQTGVVNLTTSNISEGTNLYYTQTRFDSAFAAKSTSDLSEGTNLYYTDTRARNAISVSGDLSYAPATGVISFSETYSTPNELLTAIKTVDGSTSGLDADLLDGQDGAYYLNWNNFTNVPTYDNYGGWTLLTDGVSRGTISSSENVNFAGGTNVTLSYSATNNTITIDSVDTNTTYSAGTGITLTGTTFSLTDESYTLTEKNKLAGIEVGAEVNTVDSVNTQTGAVVLDTDDVGEGISNLYYTDTRARNAISTTGDISYSPTTGVISFSETYSTANELMTALQTVDGSTSGLDADLLDGQQGSYYLDYNNFTNTPTYDNYGGWTLLTDGVSRGNIDSGESVNLVGGSNITLSYSATNNSVTINSTASGGGGLSWAIISTNTIAVANNGYLIDCSGGPITVTLPATPSEGDAVGISDFTQSSETNAITIARNGNNITGVAEDFTIDIDGAGMTFVYTNATIGWEIVTEVGSKTDLPFTFDSNDNIETANNLNVNGTLTENATTVFNKIQSSPITGTVTENPNNGRHLKLTLTGNTTLSLTSLTNTTEALPVTVEVIQDGVGGHTLSFGGTNITFPGGTSPVNSTAANAKDVLQFIWNGSEYMLINYVGDVK